MNTKSSITISADTSINIPWDVLFSSEKARVRALSEDLRQRAEYLRNAAKRIAGKETSKFMIANKLGRITTEKGFMSEMIMGDRDWYMWNVWNRYEEKQKEILINFDFSEREGYVIRIEKAVLVKSSIPHYEAKTKQYGIIIIDFADERGMGKFRAEIDSELNIEAETIVSQLFNDMQIEHEITSVEGNFGDHEIKKSDTIKGKYSLANRANKS